MPTATVTVQYVNPPKPGKKMGSIKTTDGSYYNVWPDKLSLFSSGNNYTINYTEENGFKSFKNMAEGMQSVAQAARSVTQNTTRTSGGGDAKAAEMFVMGFMNRCYQGACTVPGYDHLVAEMRILRSAWQDVWENKVPAPAPKIEPDMPSDEIPF